MTTEEDTFEALKRMPFKEANEYYWKLQSSYYLHISKIFLNDYVSNNMMNVGWDLTEYYAERMKILGN